jgi:hypothetical protein
LEYGITLATSFPLSFVNPFQPRFFSMRICSLLLLGMVAVATFGVLDAKPAKTESYIQLADRYYIRQRSQNFYQRATPNGHRNLSPRLQPQTVPPINMGTPKGPTQGTTTY